MNFSMLLFVLTLVTGAMWIVNKLKWQKTRRQAARAAVAQFENDNREAINRGERSVIDARNALYRDLTREPWWLDYTAGLFPVIVLVFALRSFLFEPFRIPSGSMLPTLYIGDFILVNKFEYGVRLPIVHTKIIDGRSPERGDVIVFRYPVDPSVDYIKRVVGVPGDTIKYVDKTIFVNGKAMQQKYLGDWVDPFSHVTLTQSEETLGQTKHLIAVDDRVGSGLRGTPYPRVAGGCTYYDNGFVCKVPEGQYFVLGDNRDNSEDSRYWGFVPEENLVGRAFFIWANFSDLSRIGSFR